MDPTNLITAIDESRKRAESKSLDVSLNELADMHESGELIVLPEYQRMFRWSSEKQSRFIESLILEMPVPPIFVIEIEEGVWELIDGLQRVSSYFHFRGILEAEKHPEGAINKGDKLHLEDCDIIPEVNGSNFDSLPTAIQIRLKRSFLNVHVIRKETDQNFKYYMFKRLNTGGESLSEQEIRNCTIRLLDPKFNDLLIELSKNTDFEACIDSLTDDRRSKMGDVELVLRFFSFKNDIDRFRHDIASFLTDYMESVTREDVEFDYQNEKKHFEYVFKVLNTALGRGACLAYKDNQPTGAFSMHHFEAFSLAVSKVVGDREYPEEVPEALISGLLAAKNDQGLREHTVGGGKNSPGPYKAKINFVIDKLELAQ